MKLCGKTREQIEAVLAGKTRSELLDIIFSLSTVEQLFKPAEIAARSIRISGQSCVTFVTGNSGITFAALKTQSQSQQAA